MDNPQPASGSFIQFGDGPKIPITDCTWPGPGRPNALEGVRFEMPTFTSAEIDIPFEHAATICRAVGMPELADRIEVETHPDLIALNARVEGGEA